MKRPHERIERNVRNRSSRNGTDIKLLVLHSTESHDRPGISDLAGIVSWFDNPNSQASSHVVIDKEGHCAKCVNDAEKAWTQRNHNPHSLSIEMIGRAAFGRPVWMARKKQRQAVVRYLAYWSERHGIPLRRGKVSKGGAVLRSGVVTHRQLGVVGGGHHDPGLGFPVRLTIRQAKKLKES